ncbi:HPr-rel-A system PqqD family peptide chaperone [Pseudothauera rhizosphaerae]|uniref:HPr-rel-A system PqqD family peptide chaperone n=1 Tax=Pseudothauera rhizosphaerae TaxID=2565932 RepID=UPI001454DE44|nr:HPr-rel-A system PqqD family peptide chaperone [Pseudothauera rhizosphaerae]
MNGPSAPQPHLLEAVWEDGAALYDRRSGDTHLLDTFTLAVLHAARAVGADPAAIHARLADSGNPQEYELSRIESALDQLMAAHLL